MSDQTHYELAERIGAIIEQMDIHKMLGELREERERIDQAILVLKRIGAGSGKRRGRPPAWMTKTRTVEEPAQPAKRRGRPKGAKSKKSSS